MRGDWGGLSSWAGTGANVHGASGVLKQKTCDNLRGDRSILFFSLEGGSYTTHLTNSNLRLDLYKQQHSTFLPPHISSPTTDQIPRPSDLLAIDSSIFCNTSSVSSLFSFVLKQRFLFFYYTMGERQIGVRSRKMRSHFSSLSPALFWKRNGRCILGFIFIGICIGVENGGGHRFFTAAGPRPAEFSVYLFYGIRFGRVSRTV